MPVQHDDVVAAANRDATKAKAAGDWDMAVALLRQAKAQQGNLYHDTRLAKFLQQAGRLDDALQEIEWLIDQSHTWAKAFFSHQPASVLQAQRVGWLRRVLADAVLICKRAKRADLQGEYERRRQVYVGLHARLEVVAKTDSAALSAGWDEARKQGSKAMRAFLVAREQRIARNK